MKKQTKKILVWSLLVLSTSALTTSLTANLNFNINKNQKDNKKEFTSIDSNYFWWPNEGESVQAEVNGVMSTIYTPLASDYEIYGSGNTYTLQGFRSNFAKKAAKENIYLNVKIPSEVTEVGEGAFTSLKWNMTHNHQQNWGNFADTNNKILRVDFTPSRGLNALNHRSFNGIKNLQLVNFDEMVIYHVTQLGMAIFEDCVSLRKIFNFENFNTTYIQNDMFKNNKKLEHIKFPRSLKVIGDYAFEGTNLQTADLSDTSLTAIKSNAFLNSNIKAAYIPDGAVLQANSFKTGKNNLNAYKINMQAKNYTTETLKNIGVDPTVPTSKKEIKVYFNKKKFNNDFRYPNWVRDSFNELTMSEKAKYFIVAGPEQKTLPGEAYFRTLSMNEAGNFDMSFAHNYNVTYFNEMPPEETIFQRHNQRTTQTSIYEKDSSKIEAQLKKEIDSWNANPAFRNDPRNFMMMQYGFSFKINYAPDNAKLQLLSFEKTSSNNFKASLKLTNAVVNSEPNATLTAHSEIKTISGMQFTSTLKDKTIKGNYTEENFKNKLNSEIDLFNEKMSYSNEIDHNNPFINFEILNSLKLNISNFNSNTRLKRIDWNVAQNSSLDFQIEALNNLSTYLPNEKPQSIASITFTIKFDNSLPPPTPPTPDTKPPVDNGGGEINPPKPPVDNGEGEINPPKPPVDNGEGEIKPPKPPVEPDPQPEPNPGPGPDNNEGNQPPPNGGEDNKPSNPNDNGNDNTNTGTDKKFFTKSTVIFLGSIIGGILLLTILIAIIIKTIKKKKS